MENPKTRWDQLQSRFKNSWIGIIILALIALMTAVAQVGNSTKTMIASVRPSPAAELRPITPTVTPLEQFGDKVVGVGPGAIYPIGATLEFKLVHDGLGADDISIDGVDVRIDAYDPSAACPFRLAGDRFFGGLEAPVREFTVFLADKKVSSVRYKAAPNEPTRRGHSNDLLATEDSSTWLKVRKNDDTERMKVKFIAEDAAQYRVGLSIRYSNRDGAKAATIPSIAICKPQENAG
ncbi:MAG: hypothetical protein QOD09_2870 [Bradyrhizobium sp.]|nr:hypothetical protein [Bradyrhizobium sp.]